jgi:hypothetical protein
VPELVLTAKHYTFDTPLTARLDSVNTQRAVITVDGFESTPLQVLDTDTTSLVFASDTTETNTVALLCLPEKRYLLATERSLYLVESDLTGAPLLSTLSTATDKYQHNQLLLHPDGHWLWYRGQAGGVGRVSSSATDSITRWGGNEVEADGQVYLEPHTAEEVYTMCDAENTTDLLQRDATDPTYFFLRFCQSRTIIITHLGLKVTWNDDTIDYGFSDRGGYLGVSNTNIQYGNITEEDCSGPDSNGTYWYALPTPIQTGPLSEARAETNTGLYVVIRPSGTALEVHSVAFPATTTHVLKPLHATRKVEGGILDYIGPANYQAYIFTDFSDESTTHSYGIDLRYTVPLFSPYQLMGLTDDTYPVLVQATDWHNGGFGASTISESADTRGLSWNSSGWLGLYTTGYTEDLERGLFLIQQPDGVVHTGTLKDNAIRYGRYPGAGTAHQLDIGYYYRVQHGITPYAVSLDLTGCVQPMATKNSTALLADDTTQNLYVVSLYDTTTGLELQNELAVIIPQITKVATQVRAGWQQFAGVRHPVTGRSHVFYFNTPGGFLMHKISDDDTGVNWSATTLPSNMDSQRAFPSSTRLTASVSTEGRIAVFVSTTTDQILLVSHTDGTFTPTALVHSVATVQIAV